MKYKITERGAEFTLSDGFDLKNTFECGQCFRWSENEDGSYSGIVRGKKARVYKDSDNVIIEGSDEKDFENIWRKYFDTDCDYHAIREEIKQLCPQVSCAVESTDGIRILSQEPWEALCSFIISQNNNIPRIRGIVKRLCENFGENIGGEYSFPSAEALSDLQPEDLSVLRAGFRARYIIDAAKKVSSGEVNLVKMYEAPIGECRKELMTITGVGVKVAECTLLYGLHRMEAFPIDVWMKKALAADFSGVTPEVLGKTAGIAQQYIFHYMRNSNST